MSFFLHVSPLLIGFKDRHTRQIALLLLLLTLKDLQPCMSSVDPVDDALVMNIQNAANRTKTVAFIHHLQA